MVLLLLTSSGFMKNTQIKLINRAEEAVMHYAGDPILWLKDKCDFDPRPTQAVQIREILSHSSILDLAPPRFGKTVEVEMACLYETATTPYEDYRIWAPKEQQAVNSLRYQTDAIENSPILNAWVAVKKGKKQLSTTSYEFWNHSSAKAFGINSNFEGENATIIRGEEFDDMDYEVWKNRVLHRGAGANRNGKPTRLRITGTLQAGRGNIYTISKDPQFHNLRAFDVYDGLALNYYDEDYVRSVRITLTNDEWLRIYLLKFTEAKTFIRKKHIMIAQQLANRISWQGATYQPGEQYKPTGHVYGSLDMGHAGEKKGSSNYSAQFIEVIGDTILYLGGKRWKPTEDTNKIKREYCDLWEFYGARDGYGDALKADVIADINDMLYARRLISVDRKQFADNTQANWGHWSFAPRWNTGQAKWQWAEGIRNKLEAGNILIPYFDQQESHPMAMSVHNLKQNLLNVRIEKTQANYPRIGYIDPIIGDDDFDSFCMAVGCAHDRSPAIVNFKNLGIVGGHREIGLPQESIAGQFGPSDFHENLSISR